MARRHRKLIPTQAQVDRWHPTTIRWIGTCALIYGIFVDHGVHPGILPAAAGAILYGLVTPKVGGGE